MEARRRDFLKLAGGVVAASLAPAPALFAAKKTTAVKGGHGDGIYGVRSFDACWEGSAVVTPWNRNAPWEAIRTLATTTGRNL